MFQLGLIHREQEVILGQVESYEIAGEDFFEVTEAKKGRVKETKKEGLLPIPLSFDMGRFKGHVTADQIRRRYKLVGVIHHSGPTAISGHYSGVFTGPNGVSRVDDGRVSFGCAAHLLKLYKDGDAERRPSSRPKAKKGKPNDAKNGKEKEKEKVEDLEEIEGGYMKRLQEKQEARRQKADKADPHRLTSAFEFEEEFLKGEKRKCSSPHILVYKRLKQGMYGSDRN
jgi:hypothetical protein